LLTLDGLRTRFARDPHSLVDIASDIDARFAAFGGACARTPLYEAARDLLARCPDPSALPLWGVPYLASSNVDVVGLPTSIGVPALDFQPDFDAVVVERLRAAGALLVGKVPDDPFGLGGSNAEIAMSVAAGLAAFGIACDRSGLTAAGRCGVFAIEPTRGLVSRDGLFATAPDLDGIVVFAADVGGGVAVRRVIEEAAHAEKRPAVPFTRLGLLGEGMSALTHDGAEWCRPTVMIDDAPFADVAALMNEDVWLALRLDDVAVIFAELPEAFSASVHPRLSRAFGCSIHTQIGALRRLSDARRRVEANLAGCDMLFIPREPDLTGSISACGLAAIALPDGGTLVGPGGSDEQLADAVATLVIPGSATSTRPIDIPASSPLAHW
jgi:allophanate hydrolase